MIEFLKGILLQKDPIHLLIDVNGVGYGVNVSVRTSEKCANIQEEIALPVYLHVKEGIMELYGFLSEIEKEVFLRLITVSGIGPKIALRMLSEIAPEALVSEVINGNIRQLTALKGIGKKTAEVMVASLRSPFSKLKITEQAKTQKFESYDKTLSDTIKALIALGVKESSAQTAAEKAYDALDRKSTTSQTIPEALKLL
ncbi:MAG: Holliday junction branch migration protein RuvA [Fibrobacteria bacterium]|nr:Holliday junction branch migration protein RuvA [Fibrobacteria bacterium]